MMNINYEKNETLKRLGKMEAIGGWSVEGALIRELLEGVTFDNVKYSDIAWLLTHAFHLGMMFAKGETDFIKEAVKKYQLIDAYNSASEETKEQIASLLKDEKSESEA